MRRRRREALPLPQAAGGHDFALPLLAAMAFLAPAVGVPHEEMLQDTLKSMLVAFATLVAALLFFWQRRRSTEPLRWHPVLLLPLGLAAYAAGSMAWSHTYLAGVETVRWTLFALLLWLGLNTLTREREREPLLALGIHAGALVASLWTALQFWIDLRLFPQGPNPGSTFVNRNFFAEFAVCTLPFGVLLLARARSRTQAVLAAFGSGFVIVAILMTGTRAALIALWVLLGAMLPLLAWLYRRQLPFGRWDAGTRWLVVGVLLATVLGLGSLRTGNEKIVLEERGTTPLARALNRTQSIRADDPSLGLRRQMWRATGDMIAAHPLAGVGAGAWENEIPLHQAPGTQLETDYYAHNEFLQLVAEYGLAGWAFLGLLAAYLLQSAWRTLRLHGERAAEAPGRALVLCALLALFIVSNVGFPWRMASTGALFALCLAWLAASDARLGLAGAWAARPLPWRPRLALPLAALCVAGLLLAGQVSWIAARSEALIVRAARLALMVSAAPDPQAARWNAAKAEMLRLVREGTDLNPHYRKITPLVADALAGWGDWANATWIWESVLSSRPNIVAILTNAARGHASMGHADQAWALLLRAQAIQPDAPSVRSLEVILLARAGHERQALERARAGIAEGLYDFDLLNTAFLLGWRLGDSDAALQAMELRQQHWPEHRVEGWMQLGRFWLQAKGDRERAVDAFGRALALAPEASRAMLLRQMPEEVRGRLEGEARSRP